LKLEDFLQENLRKRQCSLTSVEMFVWACYQKGDTSVAKKKAKKAAKKAKKPARKKK